MVLVGHSDGGLLALMAAARALKSKVSIQVLALCCCEFYLINGTSIRDKLESLILILEFCTLASWRK
jgi:pimeloyl-ACP methyl ester carboxylesterase